MLVIHNGKDLFPTNAAPVFYREGAWATKPDGDKISPTSEGLDMGGGWVMATPLPAASIEQGSVSTGDTVLAMVNGVPQYVTPTKVLTPDETVALQTKIKKEDRNDLLLGTDWEVIRALEALLLSDTPLGIYRQALRDAPAQADFLTAPLPTRN